MKKWLAGILARFNAGQIAVLSFGTVILVGTVLLMLPLSTNGKPLGFVDSLFTSTSAVCVTGLIVVDTGSRFTTFGQGVILGLIQVGGFGIMTFSTFILFVLGRRASITVVEAAGGSFLKLSRYSLTELMLRALVFTAAVEAAGFILLFSRFIFDFEIGQALWLSFFHSVSAFCNAGFSLFSDSLVGYAGDPLVNFTVMIQIIAGGIGFFVVVDLWDSLRRHDDPAKRRISFHTKIVLTMTVLLVLGGTVIIYLIERNHGLSGLPWYQGVQRALFQSVTARTAGFNTMDTGSLANASLFLLVVLMAIGGAPGSMAGGVKVTTAGVLLIVVFGRLMRRRTASIFGRSVAEADLERAVSLMLISTVIIAGVTLVLLVTELGGTPHPESRGLMAEILFETVSAFGTVGLSTGATPELGVAGRLIITATMFAGRLGPLTLVFAMERKKSIQRFRYPEEKIMIG